MYVSMTCNLVTSAIIFLELYFRDPSSINETNIIFPIKKKKKKKKKKNQYYIQAKLIKN
jgi:hypothetical protein